MTPADWHPLLPAPAEAELPSGEKVYVLPAPGRDDTEWLREMVDFVGDGTFLCTSTPASGPRVSRVRELMRYFAPHLPLPPAKGR
jgi:hypothetical protein